MLFGEESVFVWTEESLDPSGCSLSSVRPSTRALLSIHVMTCLFLSLLQTSLIHKDKDTAATERGCSQAGVVPRGASSPLNTTLHMFRRMCVELFNTDSFVLWQHCEAVK